MLSEKHLMLIGDSSINFGSLSVESGQDEETKETGRYPQPIKSGKFTKEILPSDFDSDHVLLF